MLPRLAIIMSIYAHWRCLNRAIVFVVCAFVITGGVAYATEQSVTIEMSAGDMDRVDSIVFYDLPDSLADAKFFSLTRIEDGESIPVQRLGDDDPQVVWIVKKKLAAGTSRRYRLAAVDRPTGEPTVTCKDDGKSLIVAVGDLTVLKYNHAVVEPPEGMESYYRRSGYIHPVLTPGGCEVTGDFAPDHAHQHAVFYAIVKSKFQGRKIDFWNQFKKTGRIRHLETLSTCSGSVFAGFTVRLRHEDITTPGSPVAVLDEIWTVRVYNLSDGFLFDLKSTLSCASDLPLLVEQNHYGGMGLRGRTPWLTLKTADGTMQDFLTSEGKTRKDGNSTPARWVEMHGPLEPGDSAEGIDHAGLAVFSSPNNFRAPQHVRLHPTKPYFCFSPMIEGEYEISPGKTYDSRYRFHVHDGRPSVDKNQSLWKDYADGPKIDVVK